MRVVPNVFNVEAVLYREDNKKIWYLIIWWSVDEFIAKFNLRP